MLPTPFPARTPLPSTSRRSACVAPARSLPPPSLDDLDELDRLAPPLGRDHRPGQGAPPAIQVLKLATKTSCGTETGARPTPGSQPHATSLSWLTCSSIAATALPPVRSRSLIVAHSSAGVSPMNTIFCRGEGRRQFGAPGGTCAP